MESFELILLRHGQTQSPGKLIGSTDVPLSDKGFRQMEKAKEKLCNVTSIGCSALQRCLIPAQQWAQAANLPLYVNAGWNEYHFGQWEGLFYEQLSADTPEWYQLTQQNIPESENFTAFETRVWQTFEQWQENSSGAVRLLLCHGGTIAVLLSKLLDINFEPAQHIGVFRGGYACLSVMPPYRAWLTTLNNPDPEK